MCSDHESTLLILSIRLFLDHTCLFCKTRTCYLKSHLYFSASLAKCLSPVTWKILDSNALKSENFQQSFRFQSLLDSKNFKITHGQLAELT